MRHLPVKAQAIAFDLDRTLIDRSSIALFKWGLVARMIPKVDIEWLHANHAHKPAVRVFEMLAEKGCDLSAGHSITTGYQGITTLQPPADESPAGWAHWYLNEVKFDPADVPGLETMVLPGAQLLLDQLAETEIPLALNTNARTDSVAVAVRHSGIRLPIRMHRVTGNIVGGRYKPHPYPTQLAAELCGVDVGDLVMIGDNLDDVLSAWLSGATAILVGNGEPKPTLNYSTLARMAADVGLSDLAPAQCDAPNVHFVDNLESISIDQTTSGLVVKPCSIGVLL